MTWLQDVWKSSIGAKITMAVTGLLLTLFVCGHLVGNMLIFGGQDALNTYAQFLQSKGSLLWVVRLAMLTIVAVHVTTALRLYLDNRRARGVKYAFDDTVQASLSSRTMVLTGLVLLTYVIYHILHFTVGVTSPSDFGHLDAQGRHDVYRMVVQGFQRWPVTGVYVLAQVFLFLHLRHGIASLFQTLGLNHPRYTLWVERIGYALAVVLAGGNMLIPLSVLFGIVTLPGA